MTVYIFDSSALVKRYIPEVGSTWVQSIITRSAANTIFVSQITPVEIISATQRRVRKGTLSPRDGKAIRLFLHRHYMREYNEIPLVDVVIQEAESLLERHPLRAADAIQLASALEVQRRILVRGGAAPLFICADQRLLTAAIAENLATDDPTLHP